MTERVKGISFMQSNVVVFTTGSSGSSVLAGLIATQGYWLGYETKKLNFDTYENAELVDLNMIILKETGLKKRDCNDLPAPSIKKIEGLVNKIDLKPFYNFLKKCERNQPWLWKDPRLAFTIHFWDQIANFSKTRFIYVYRDPLQSYAGLILSRKVPMSFKEQNLINNNYQKNAKIFFDKYHINPHKILFEDFILHPEKTIDKLNMYLNTKLSVEDFKSIYKGQLYKKRYSVFDCVFSIFKYLIYRYLKRDYVVFPFKTDAS